MLFLGCDAGSSKIEIMLAEATGTILAHEVFSACNYISAGYDAFARHMRQALERIYRKAGRSPDETACSVYGLTSYGEMEGMEEAVPKALGPYAPADRSLVVNDAAVGLAGSLGGSAGINAVAGTGSIVYGDDGSGNTVRAGGWSLLFDDLGSGCWIGRQVLAAFYRQADGREPKTHLYGLVREHFGLTGSDWHLVGKLRGIEQEKSKIAALQLLAEQAALAGDTRARALYTQAAGDLAEQVAVVWKQLQSLGASPLPVSYSGGVFKSGALILEPFGKRVEAMGLHLKAPLYSPCLGAVALAARTILAPAAVKELLESISRL